jgi:glycosyltransferase involved in cell wall biosynthesis
MPGRVISVIICVRDGEAFLREALDSIADQALPNVEAIVVDDGSQDNSAAIARSHRIEARVVSQPPSGLSAALNCGVRIASGEFVAFLDHDDVWPSGRLSDMLAAIRQAPELDAVYGKVVNTNADLVPLGDPVAVRLLGALLVRRKAALQVGEFRTDIVHAAILDWMSRATTAGLQFREVDRVVLLRRIHGENLGLRQRSTAPADLLKVIRDHVQRNR